LAYATDAQLVALDLATLADDRHFFPYYAPAATVRKEFLDRYPDLLTRVNPVAPLLTNAVMAWLNHEVDYNGRTPTDVAHDFLVRNGLVP
jgi:glycine betaine/choline ABC-type transport system substrate-binding protein